MSVLNKVIQGIPLVKGPLNLPATGTGTLFTVAGSLGGSGSVLVTGLLGLITTAAGATATTVSLGTGLGGVASVATAVAVTSKGVGTWLGPAPATSAGAPGALVVGTVFATPYQVPGVLSPFFVAAGDVITWTTSATDTGAVKWYLWYTPLDGDGSVS